MSPIERTFSLCTRKRTRQSTWFYGNLPGCRKSVLKAGYPSQGSPLKLPQPCV